MNRSPARAWIGTSGWNYSHWSGIFYPPEMKPRSWFGHYATLFDTVEVNNTFYRLPSPEIFIRWGGQAPAGFHFALKASRFITHVKRLLEPERSAGEFLRRAARLQGKLGPILFQMPPSGQAHPARLRLFLEYLLRQEVLPGVRVAFEFREAGWLTPEVFTALEKANVALCLADWPDLVVEGPVTADFVYIRRHGASGRYVGSYSPAALRHQADRIRGWLAEDRSVYVYFNNDAGAHAVANALHLKELLA
ncbi:MAG TPA: DUF72 domain-containing protein [Candidatus Methylomirabilis sp.]|nr:DUF72 domain-containing protein [Candidatus Methylomirabilis sp.]